MTATRTLLVASLVGLSVTVVAGAAAPLVPLMGDAWQAQTVTDALHSLHWPVGLFGFLVPAFTALHLHSVDAITKRPAPPGKAKRVAALWLTGSLALALATWIADSWWGVGLTSAAWLMLLAAAGMTTGMMLAVLPKRGHSVVDVARDPLTKGDDASFQHLRFAHFMLPVAVAVMAAGDLASTISWGSNISRAGAHLLLAAYALFSCYGLSHLWVPRLSGVPAIAAGAIKGELHSSLLALLFLLPGFLFDVRGLVIAGGAFLFLGAFTWMGVLGANIMRNKSKTHQVTPEFVYVPWTFTGVFWLISGVLLGIFLNVVPDLFADRAAGLRFAHIHIALFGGFAQILLGLATRLMPAAQGQAVVPFSRAKWGFYALNAGLCAMLYGHLAEGIATTTFRVGALLSVLGLAAAFMSLTRHRPAAGGSS